MNLLYPCPADLYKPPISLSNRPRNHLFDALFTTPGNSCSMPYIPLLGAPVRCLSLPLLACSPHPPDMLTASYTSLHTPLMHPPPPDPCGSAVSLVFHVGPAGCSLPPGMVVVVWHADGVWRGCRSVGRRTWRLVPMQMLSRVLVVRACPYLVWSVCVALSHVLAV